MSTAGGLSAAGGTFATEGMLAAGAMSAAGGYVHGRDEVDCMAAGPQ